MGRATWTKSESGPWALGARDRHPDWFRLPGRTMLSHSAQSGAVEEPTRPNWGPVSHERAGRWGEGVVPGPTTRPCGKDSPFSELQRTTSLFITEYIGQCFCPRCQFGMPEAVPGSLEGAVLDRLGQVRPPDPSEGTFEPYNWVPPNLTEGGAWYNDQVDSLRAAAAQ